MCVTMEMGTWVYKIEVCWKIFVAWLEWRSDVNVGAAREGVRLKLDRMSEQKSWRAPLLE